jgi:hypothetical protein
MKRFLSWNDYTIQGVKNEMTYPDGPQKSAFGKVSKENGGKTGLAGL